MIITSKVPLKRCVYDRALQRYQSIFSVVRQKEQPSFSQFSDHCILKSHKFRELKQTKNLCPPSDMKKELNLCCSNICQFVILCTCYQPMLLCGKTVSNRHFILLHLHELTSQSSTENRCLGKWKSASLQMQKSASEQM